MADEAELSKPEWADVPDRLRAELAQSGQSQAVAARLIGVSAPVVSQFLAGSYPGDVAVIAAKVSAWLARQTRGREIASGAVQDDVFVMTPIARDVLRSLEFVQSQRKPGATMIAGAPGVGKTAAITHFKDVNTNVWVVTIVRGVDTPYAFAKVLAGHFGLKIAGHDLVDMVAKIGGRLRGTGGMLILDEAQNLSEAALETARGIHEEIGIHLALCGDPTLAAKIEALPQLRSRLRRPVVINRVSLDDVAMAAAQFGVIDDACVKLLWEMAGKSGRLRNVAEACRLASMAMADGAAPDLRAINFAINDANLNTRGAA